MSVGVRNHRFEGLGRTISICERVWCIWQNHRQNHSTCLESFGVLVGSTSLDRRAIHIHNVTTPMPADIQTRHSFRLRDPQHQSTVDAAYAISGGSQIYLGTWHTHPQPIPFPSDVDKADWWKCVDRNSSRPLVFVIVGTRRTHVYVPFGFWFRKLKVS